MPRKPPAPRSYGDDGRPSKLRPTRITAKARRSHRRVAPDNNMSGPLGSSASSSESRAVRFASREQGPSGTGDADYRGKSPSRTAMRSLSGDSLPSLEEDLDFDDRFEELVEDMDVGIFQAGLTEQLASWADEEMKNQRRIKLLFREDSPNKDNGKDDEVAECMAALTEMIIDFAGRYFYDDIEDGNRVEFKKQFLDDFSEDDELVRYINRLAMPGRPGASPWWELLTERESRLAIVVAIIGRILKEEVLEDIWFGGKEEERKKLIDLEKSPEWLHMEGFERAKLRAMKIKRFALVEDLDLLSEKCFDVTSRISKILEGLLDPGRGLSEEWSLFMARSTEEGSIQEFVLEAASLSRLMRQAPDVVYNWPALFKDELFEPSRMESLNLIEMIRSSPYEKQEVDGYAQAMLDNGAEARSDALVQIVCFPGVVAYRQYGGDLGEAVLAADKSGHMRVPPDVQRANARNTLSMRLEPSTSKTGFRSRTLAKNLVYLTWGRQRLLTKEAGTAAHMKAVEAGPAAMKRYQDDSAEYEMLFDVVRRAALARRTRK